VADRAVSGEAATTRKSCTSRYGRRGGSLAVQLRLDITGDAAGVVQFGGSRCDAVEDVQLCRSGSDAVEDVEFRCRGRDAVEDVEFRCRSRDAVEDVQLCRSGSDAVPPRLRSAALTVPLNVPVVPLIAAGVVPPITAPSTVPPLTSGDVRVLLVSV